MYSSHILGIYFYILHYSKDNTGSPNTVVEVVVHCVYFMSSIWCVWAIHRLFLILTSRHFPNTHGSPVSHGG